MAKKSARKTKKSAQNSEPKVSRSLKREMIGILLFALTALLLFAIFSFGGPLVTDSFHNLRVAVGFAVYLLPAITASIGVMLFRTDGAPRGLNFFGFVLLVASLAGLFHVGISGDAALQAAQAGNGGGFVGYGIASAMLSLLNTAASSIILISVAAISVILATNTGLGDIARSLVKLFKRSKTAGVEAVTDMTPTGLKVNDNSGNSLPVRGKLELGGGRPVKPDLPETALTAGADEDWKAPDFGLIAASTTKADAGDIKANASTIKHTMESFGIDVKMDEVNVGPTVTQYTFIPPDGVKLNKITALDTNLALSLAAHPIRIEAPIPGKSAVGVEIPNKHIAVVRMRDLLASPEIVNNKSPLTFVLGRDVSGQAMSADLAKMPHMLIAGATGSGKSVMINALLTCLLYRNSPNNLKLILVDPKRVELGLYNDIPHLLTPVIVEPEKCISALKWAVEEMTRRYKLLAQAGNRNIVEYNKNRKSESMPYIVIVIDELADLMVVASQDVETLIVRLAQMARAVGIHLVLATQRPSVNVITGIIKANIPARIAFSVVSQVDSRTIIDQMGADKLLGKGDMLFVSPDFIKPRRIQGVFVEEKETKAVTDYLREQRRPDYNEEVLNQKVNLHGKNGNGSGGGGGGGGMGDVDDDLFEEAAQAVIRAGKASTSMLQRRLRIGYARAARLVDLLEEQGIVGPADGARPRDVLVSSLSAVQSGGVVEPDLAMRQAEPYDE
jgi:S-DNA-T family DNA segregation ATPase FtsK/SpoIIIE